MDNFVRIICIAVILAVYLPLSVQAIRLLGKYGAPVCQVAMQIIPMVILMAVGTYAIVDYFVAGG